MFMCFGFAARVRGYFPDILDILLMSNIGYVFINWSCPQKTGQGSVVSK